MRLTVNGEQGGVRHSDSGRGAEVVATINKPLTHAQACGRRVMTIFVNLIRLLQAAAVCYRAYACLSVCACCLLYTSPSPRDFG